MTAPKCVLGKQGVQLRGAKAVEILANLGGQNGLRALADEFFRQPLRRLVSHEVAPESEALKYSVFERIIYLHRAAGELFAIPETGLRRMAPIPLPGTEFLVRNLVDSRPLLRAQMKLRTAIGKAFLQRRLELDNPLC